ncbi:MAG: hypothetical protein OHK0011_12600 [Turneriella sp.]
MWSRIRFCIEVLSLDVCAGVLGSAALAKTILQAQMKPCWWLLLPASVWVIYTVDHLFDAHKTGSAAVNPRHKFHSDHFLPLALSAIAMGLGCVGGAFWCLREIVFLGGAFMGTLALTHLALAYWGRIRIGKELSVAVIYTSGIWFAPFLNRRVEVSLEIALAFLIFFLAAVLNLFMNSVIEYSLDDKEQQVYILKTISPKIIRRFVVITAVMSTLAGILIASAVLPIAHRWEFTYLMFLCAVPGCILLFERFFRANARYRLPAELSFLAGIALLLQ